MAPESKQSPWKIWLREWNWEERITNFTPSWFTVTMGTGVMTQLLVDFPYPAQWLRNLGYCFWVYPLGNVPVPLARRRGADHVHLDS